AFTRVNMFVDFRTEFVEGSLKRTGTELEQEITKKQKLDDVQETTEVELVEGSSKRAGTELEQEITKKKKVDYVQETAKV
ncbi:hypothetical protein Tco_0634428, partial [Tanacetum coccineum]